MLSTANATCTGTLTHTRTIGHFVVAATIRQVGMPGGVPTTRCLVYQTNIESHTLTHTRPTANWLKGGQWAKQTRQSSKQLEKLYRKQSKLPSKK